MQRTLESHLGPLSILTRNLAHAILDAVESHLNSSVLRKCLNTVCIPRHKNHPLIHLLTYSMSICWTHLKSRDVGTILFWDTVFLPCSSTWLLPSGLKLNITFVAFMAGLSQITQRILRLEYVSFLYSHPFRDMCFQFLKVPHMSLAEPSKTWGRVPQKGTDRGVGGWLALLILPLKLKLSLYLMSRES